MKLAARLERLERAQGAPLPEMPELELDLAPDVLRRVAVAKAAGTFPKSLPDADLEAILAAADKAKGAR